MQHPGRTYYLVFSLLATVNHAQASGDVNHVVSNLETSATVVETTKSSNLTPGEGKRKRDIFDKRNRAGTRATLSAGTYTYLQLDDLGDVKRGGSTRRSCKNTSQLGSASSG